MLLIIDAVLTPDILKGVSICGIPKNMVFHIKKTIFPGGYSVGAPVQTLTIRNCGYSTADMILPGRFFSPSTNKYSIQLSSEQYNIPFAPATKASVTVWVSWGGSEPLHIPPKFVTSVQIRFYSYDATIRGKTFTIPITLFYAK